MTVTPPMDDKDRLREAGHLHRRAQLRDILGCCYRSYLTLSCSSLRAGRCRSRPSSFKLGVQPKASIRNPHIHPLQCSSQHDEFLCPSRTPPPRPRRSRKCTTDRRWIDTAQRYAGSATSHHRDHLYHRLARRQHSHLPAVPPGRLHRPQRTPELFASLSRLRIQPRARHTVSHKVQRRRWRASTATASSFLTSGLSLASLIPY